MEEADDCDEERIVASNSADEMREYSQQLLSAQPTDSIHGPITQSLGILDSRDSQNSTGDQVTIDSQLDRNGLTSPRQHQADDDVKGELSRLQKSLALIRNETSRLSEELEYVLEAKVAILTKELETVEARVKNLEYLFGQTGLAPVGGYWNRNYVPSTTAFSHGGPTRTPILDRFGLSTNNFMQNGGYYAPSSCIAPPLQHAAVSQEQHCWGSPSGQYHPLLSHISAEAYFHSVNDGVGPDGWPMNQPLGPDVPPPPTSTAVPAVGISLISTAPFAGSPFPNILIGRATMETTGQLSVPEPAFGSKSPGNMAGYQDQFKTSDAEWSSATPEERKQILGERLFPLVHLINPKHAGKITGMLLERDDEELSELIERPEWLRKMVSKALAILETHHLEGASR